ncbi:MAG: amidase [Proteobacteria bacterium]|nr:amidase [Pseudomonadota bacterium]
MSDLELCYTPALELARLIAAKTISPVEVVKNSLARIEEVNGKLNCFCFTYPDEAIEKAKAAEAAVLAGESLGPLHGVPIAIKDLTPTKGKRTTFGSYIYENYVPDEDALVVQNLLGAGAIMVGKTTTPEFAFSSLTDTPLWGITRNPWNTERTPGGSSGGSAAAVAAGAVPLAEGSDAGGSVRIPAAHSGCVGLKPSSGRIPFEFLPTQYDFMLCHGPLCRTIADAALFLDICQGPDERDLNTLIPALEVPVPPPSGIKGMRLALSVDYGYYAIDPDVEANTRAAAEAFKEAGAEVEEVELGWTADFNYAWWSYWNVFEAALFGEHLEKWREKMHPSIVSAMEDGLKMSAVDFYKTQLIYTEAWNKLREVFERCDALLCPTEAIPAPPVEYDELGSIGVDEDGKFVNMDMTMQFNALKLPALSVPSGFSKEGLPTGLQIVGKRTDDLTVLRIGAAFETLRPWAQYRPPL